MVFERCWVPEFFHGALRKMSGQKTKYYAYRNTPQSNIRPCQTTTVRLSNEATSPPPTNRDRPPATGHPSPTTNPQPAPITRNRSTTRNQPITHNRPEVTHNRPTTNPPPSAGKPLSSAGVRELSSAVPATWLREPAGDNHCTDRRKGIASSGSIFYGWAYVVRNRTHDGPKTHTPPYVHHSI